MAVARLEHECWSERTSSYARVAGSDELDASLLLAAVIGYDTPGRRLDSTIQAIRRELGNGPLLYRYSGEDGLGGQEGSFVCCSFWLAEALARAGRVDQAVELMDELVGLASDLGLYAEEIEPTTGEFASRPFRRDGARQRPAAGRSSANGNVGDGR